LFTPVAPVHSSHLFAMLSFLQLSHAADVARVREGTRPMPVGETGPGNLLPTFRWQAGAAEGSSAVSTSATSPNPAENDTVAPVHS